MAICIPDQEALGSRKFSLCDRCNLGLQVTVQIFGIVDHFLECAK